MNRHFIQPFSAAVGMLSALLCLCYINSSAQSTIVRAKLDTASILIGDQQKLSIEVKANSKDKVIFPLFADTLVAHVELVDKGKTDTVFSNDKNNYILSRKYTITSFDSGYYVIPPLKVVVNGDTQETEALLLTVQTLAVDTNKAIKDIKQPYDAPWSISEIMKEIIIGAVALLVLSLVIYYFVKKPKKEPVVVEEVKEVIPPHVIALEELNKLRDEKLWQEGKYKLYHIRLSDTVRAYIEKRFDINAPEQTTYETLQSLRNVHIPDEAKVKLRQLLMLSDMVKFAKENPLGNENELSWQNAIDFVNATILIQTDNVKEVRP
jgi:hypothetical protein